MVLAYRWTMKPIFSKYYKTFFYWKLHTGLYRALCCTFTLVIRGNPWTWSADSQDLEERGLPEFRWIQCFLWISNQMGKLRNIWLFKKCYLLSLILQQLFNFALYFDQFDQFTNYKFLYWQCIVFCCQ